MGLPNEDSSKQGSKSDDTLFEILLDCQKLGAACDSATDPAEQELLNRQYHSSVARLYHELRTDLLYNARRWPEEMGMGVETRALNMFTNIYLALPRIRASPGSSLRHYLLKIAKNGMIDEYNLVYSDLPRRPATKEPDPAPISGIADVAMWPTSICPAVMPGSESLEELPDMRSFDAEDHLVDVLDLHCCLDEAIALWGTWPPDDQLLMQQRWLMEPPVEYKEIADQIGTGCTDTMLRQRFRRLKTATILHLRGRGLIDVSDVAAKPAGASPQQEPIAGGATAHEETSRPYEDQGGYV